MTLKVIKVDLKSYIEDFFQLCDTIYSVISQEEKYNLKLNAKTWNNLLTFSSPQPVRAAAGESFPDCSVSEARHEPAFGRWLCLAASDCPTSPAASGSAAGL